MLSMDNDMKTIEERAKEYAPEPLMEWKIPML